MLTYDDEGFDADEARRATEDAIRAGEADVIYQAYLTDGTWRGFADFLERAAATAPTSRSTRSSRAPRSRSTCIQLSFYAEQLGRIQGRLPEHVHVELGTGERETFRTAEFIAFFRRSRERLLAATRHAEARRRDVSLARLPLRDLRLPAPLPAAARGRRQPRARRGARAAVRGAAPRRGHPHAHRARRDRARDDRRAHPRRELRTPPRPGRLQLHFTRTGERLVELLPDEEDRGFRLLPPPSEGDVWLDLEGHPFYEPARGLEYLFGYCYREDGEVRYDAVWGLDRDGEKAAFERFVDWLEERRRRFPDLHVYHYAAYERVALRRLMGEHSVREAEIDDWLRRELLVDLYRVVQAGAAGRRPELLDQGDREAVRLRAHGRGRGRGGVDRPLRAVDRDGRERRARGDPAPTTRRTAARPSSCTSGCSRGGRPASRGCSPPDERERTEEAEERDAARVALHEELLAGAEEGDTRWLLAHLLYYHQREGKSQWWEWFHHLEPRRGRAHRGHGHDRRHRARRRAGRGRAVARLHASRSRRRSTRCTGAASTRRRRRTTSSRSTTSSATITLRRAKNRADEPLPTALIPPRPISDWEQRDAVERVRAVVPRGRRPLPAPREDPAPRASARRRARAGGRARGAGRASREVEGSYLFVQGPPGSGKTWTGREGSSRTDRERQAGRRRVAEPQGDPQPARARSSATRSRRASRSAGCKKSTEGNEESRVRGPASSRSSDARSDVPRDGAHELVAGTSWLFSREELDGKLDYLFVDEAGQISLADALALGTCARTLVLLGDPNQLPQVSQGAQPEEAKVSVLQHLLGDETTVPPDRGVFLERDVAPAAGAHASSPRRRTTRAGSSARSRARGGASRPGTGSSSARSSTRRTASSRGRRRDEVARGDRGAARHRRTRTRTAARGRSPRTTSSS